MIRKVTSSSYSFTLFLCCITLKRCSHHYLHHAPSWLGAPTLDSATRLDMCPGQLHKSSKNMQYHDGVYVRAEALSLRTHVQKILERLYIVYQAQQHIKSRPSCCTYTANGLIRKVISSSYSFTLFLCCTTLKRCSHQYLYHTPSFDLYDLSAFSVLNLGASNCVLLLVCNHGQQLRINKLGAQVTRIFNS